MKLSKKDKAKQALMRALGEGCVPSIKNNWTVFTPPPSVPTLVEISAVDGDALAECVREHLKSA